MTIATRSFTGPVTLLRLPASTCSHRELLIGCSHVLPGPGGATARLFPRTGSCGHRSQRRAPPPCGYMPRHAAELAQPTPFCPSCAPCEVFRVGRVYMHGLGRYGGVLGRVHVARLSISRPRPASLVPYNLSISRPDLLGLGPESLPWRQSSLIDQPNDPPAQSGRSGSSAATRAAGPIAGPSRQHGREVRPGRTLGQLEELPPGDKSVSHIIYCIYARGGCQAPHWPVSVRDCGRLGDRKHRPRRPNCRLREMHKVHMHHQTRPVWRHATPQQPSRQPSPLSHP